LPYPVNTFTVSVAAELLGRRDLLEARVRMVQAERARMSRLLRAKGRRVIEGGANFVLMSTANPAAEFERLLAGGVLLRDLSRSVPGYLRVSVGMPQETNRLLELL
jgi:histidinol-phosphate aminotransferase